MGTLTPLIDRGANPSHFEVESLKVKVWNLEGIAKSQRLIVDVELVILVLNQPLSSFRLLVPFQLDGDWQWQKLDSKECDVRLEHQEGCEVPEFSLAVDESTKNLTNGRRKRNELSDIDKAYSLQKVTIQSLAIEPGQRARFHIRFHVYSPNSIVRWKRSGFGINGALFEIGTSTSPVRLDDRLASLLSAAPCIKRSELVVIVRSSLQLRFSSPLHLDITAIDGREWESCLRRWTDFRREGALIAYQSLKDLDEGECQFAHRMFLDMSREFGLLPLGNFIRIGLGVFVILVISRWIGLVGGAYESGIRWSIILNWFVGHIPTVTPVGVLVGLSALGSRFRLVRRIYRKMDRRIWEILWSVFK